MRNRRGWLVTRRQVVKERGRRGGGPGKSGLPIDGGAARPVHFAVVKGYMGNF